MLYYYFIVPYITKSHKPSGVTAYEIGRDYIVVQFGEVIYKYSYASASKTVIEKMKRLAAASKGLSTFIAQHQPKYDDKSHT